MLFEMMQGRVFLVLPSGLAKLEHFDFHAKSLLVFYMAITLFISPANLAAGSKDYSKVFHDLRNYSQYHVHTSVSPKSNVDFRLHNTTGLISLVGYVSVNKLTAHKFNPFVFIGSSASYLTKDYT